MTERAPLIYNSSANQIQEVSLSDEVSVGILTATVFSTANVVNQTVSLANSSFNYAMIGPVTVGSGATIFVGAGVSYVVL